MLRHLITSFLLRQTTALFFWTFSFGTSTLPYVNHFGTPTTHYDTLVLQHLVPQHLVHFSTTTSAIWYDQTQNIDVWPFDYFLSFGFQHFFHLNKSPTHYTMANKMHGTLPYFQHTLGVLRSRPGPTQTTNFSSSTHLKHVTTTCL